MSDAVTPISSLEYDVASFLTTGPQARHAPRRKTGHKSDDSETRAWLSQSDALLRTLSPRAAKSTERPASPERVHSPTTCPSVKEGLHPEFIWPPELEIFDGIDHQGALRTRKKETHEVLDEMMDVFKSTLLLKQAELSNRWAAIHKVETDALRKQLESRTADRDALVECERLFQEHS